LPRRRSSRRPPPAWPPRPYSEPPRRGQHGDRRQAAPAIPERRVGGPRSALDADTAAVDRIRIASTPSAARSSSPLFRACTGIPIGGASRSWPRMFRSTPTRASDTPILPTIPASVSVRTVGRSPWWIVHTSQPPASSSCQSQVCRRSGSRDLVAVPEQAIAVHCAAARGEQFGAGVQRGDVGHRHAGTARDPLDLLGQSGIPAADPLERRQPESAHVGRGEPAQRGQAPVDGHVRRHAIGHRPSQGVAAIAGRRRRGCVDGHLHAGTEHILDRWHARPGR